MTMSTREYFGEFRDWGVIYKKDDNSREFEDIEFRGLRGTHPQLRERGA